MPVWSDYGKSFLGPNSSNWSDLEKVAHVTHINNAQRILEDKVIKRGLVYDESKLNKTRTTVNWVSPNIWHKGYRYGTVRFTFDWQSFSSDLNIYWVEAITKYSPTACRFILSKSDLSQDLPYLLKYDPEADDGPIRKLQDKWFWRKDITIEIMIDADIPLSECTTFNFVKHHPDFCNENKPNCIEKKLTDMSVGRRMMSFLIGSDIKSIDHCLIDKSGVNKLEYSGEIGLSGIFFGLKPEKNCSGFVSDIDNAKSLTLAALVHVANDRIPHAKTLISLLESDDVFEKALSGLVCDHFGFPTYAFDR